MIETILLVGAGAITLIGISSLGWGIGVYNNVKEAQQDIQEMWSNILTEYQRRADLFYNLAETVKSQKTFEKSTYIGVAEARSKASGLGNLPTKGLQLKAMQGLDSFFSKLMVVMEQYPQLKSHKLHQDLIKEVRVTEDRINIARTEYNDLVGNYNKILTTFPRNLIAGMFRFKTEIFYKNEEGTTSAPKINLG